MFHSLSSFQHLKIKRYILVSIKCYIMQLLPQLGLRKRRNKQLIFLLYVVPAGDHFNEIKKILHFAQQNNQKHEC